MTPFRESEEDSLATPKLSCRVPDQRPLPRIINRRLRYLVGRWVPHKSSEKSQLVPLRSGELLHVRLLSISQASLSNDFWRISHDFIQNPESNAKVMPQIIPIICPEDS